MMLHDEQSNPNSEGLSFLEDLKHYTAIIKRWGWLMVLVTVLAGGITFVFSRFILTPIYQASTTLLINEGSGSVTTDYNAILTSERLTRTYSKLLTKRPILEQVSKTLALNMSLEELGECISVQSVRDTQLIELTVDHSDPVIAANIANAVVMEFARQNQAIQSYRYGASKQNIESQLTDLDSQINALSQEIKQKSVTPGSLNETNQLQSDLDQYRKNYSDLMQTYEQLRLAEAQSVSNMVQVEAAYPPATPIRPRVMLNTMLASVIGFIAILGIVSIFESVDDRVRSIEDILDATNTSVLQMIPRHATVNNFPITAAQPRSPTAEIFRSLRTNIQFASVDKSLRSLIITSPLPEEGKSTVAANLAVVMAQSGRNVILVDADMRKPAMHNIFGLRGRSGLSRLFIPSEMSFDEVIQSTNIQNLWVVAAGALPPNPSELLGSDRLLWILKELNKRCDLIIFDTPPAIPVTDALVLAQRVDAVLMVVRQNKSSIQASRTTVNLLNRSGSRVLGIVLNDLEEKSLKKNSKYYKYYAVS
jgi:non-specific protein-tyrosine kinase